MDMSLSKLCETVKGGEAWRAAIHGIPKSWTGLSDWTTTIDSTSSSYFNMKSPWWHKNRASKFMKQKLIELKEKQANPQVGDCNTPLNIWKIKMINVWKIQPYYWQKIYKLTTKEIIYTCKDLFKTWEVWQMWILTWSEPVNRDSLGNPRMPPTTINRNF